jgi:hypothetical protein
MFSRRTLISSLDNKGKFSNSNSKTTPTIASKLPLEITVSKLLSHNYCLTITVSNFCSWLLWVTIFISVGDGKHISLSFEMFGKIPNVCSTADLAHYSNHHNIVTKTPYTNVIRRVFAKHSSERLRLPFTLNTANTISNRRFNCFDLTEFIDNAFALRDTRVAGHDNLYSNVHI